MEANQTQRSAVTPMLNKMIYIAARAGICSVLLLQGCAFWPASMPAEKAFALSASALSGSERYGFNGEVAVVDAGGWVANRAKYKGEVVGHGNMNMEVTPKQQGAAVNSQQPAASFQPLQLLKAINNGSASVSYAERPNRSEPVRFRIKLDKDVARKRIADSLRADLAAVRNERKPAGKNRAAAEKVLTRADQTLELALSTLQVSTVCLWSADPRTWFPRQLKEETVLQYTLGGRPYQEKRVSVTNFLPDNRSGTISK
jgi:hypothetical protein